MRIFERAYFKAPMAAKLYDAENEQVALLKDISIDGVCFVLPQETIVDLTTDLYLKLEIDLPERRTIDMKLFLVKTKHPNYHAMWNPCNEHHGMHLTQWMKRLLGDEDRFYAAKE